MAASAAAANGPPVDLGAMGPQMLSTLRATLSANATDRQDAERSLAAAETQDGYLSALLAIIMGAADGMGVSQEEMRPLRQSAAIYLKNVIRRRWTFNLAANEAQGFTENEKALVRDSCLEALARSEPLVAAQVAEAMKIVVATDYPHRWPGLMTTVMNNYVSGQDERLVAALTALRIIAKVYEFKQASAADGDPRRSLDELVEQCFPVLRTTMQSIEQTIRADQTIPPDHPLHYKQKLICKIVWSSTQYKLPPLFLNNTDHFRGWMDLLVQVLTRPVPVVPDADGDELLKVTAWKVKKWIGHTLHRIFQRYGDPKNVDGPALQAFAQAFQKDYAAHVAVAMIQVLSWPNQNLQLSSRVANLAINYLEAAISPAASWMAMVPHVETILTHILFPYMCINEDDLILWRDDPVEYVRKTYDILEDFYSPRAAAASMIFTLSKLRAKNTVMPFLGFCVQILNTYAATPHDSENKRALAMQKDGALMVIGQVKDRLLAKADLKSQLMDMVRVHVYTEIGSPYPFLRSRSCWFLGQLASQQESFLPATFTEPFGDEFFGDPELLSPALQHVLQCLQDPEFPVRVQAAVDIRHFLSNPSSKELIKPLLGALLDQLFRLIDEVDNTDIVATIEEIIDRFSVEILPHSINLTRKLTLAFLRAAGVSDEEEEASLAAVQCLHAIESIVLALASNNPAEADNMCKALELILEPILKDMFQDTRMEFLEECLDLLSTLIYYQSPPLSQFTWELYEKLVIAFHDWADEYVEHIVAPMDNYMDTGKEQFLAGANANGESYRSMAVRCVLRIWNKGDKCDSEGVEACKIAECLLLHCRGHLDEVLSTIVEAALKRLGSAELPKLQTLLFGNIGHALIYNPGMTLGVIEMLGMTRDFLMSWMQATLTFVRIHDKKSTCIAIASTLTLPANGVPQVVREHAGQLLIGAIRLAEGIKQQREKRVADAGPAKSNDNVQFKGWNDDDSDVGDDEDVEDRVEHDLIRSCMGVGDDDDMNEMDDEGDFESPLDSINEVQVLLEALNSGPDKLVQVAVTSMAENEQQHVRAFLEAGQRGVSATES